jgi:antitoxin (DNA-binding transcriptional repressor) of toxin-antitoxin stability system
MSTHSVAEAKNTLPTLIDRALAGEEIVISRHGRPVVALRALEAAPAPVSADVVQWLRAHRVGRPRDLSAGELLSRMRDDE